MSTSSTAVLTCLFIFLFASPSLCLTIGFDRYVYPFFPNFIIGGSTVRLGEAPYQVSVQQDKEGHVCGGALVSMDFVITAAHCVYGSAFTDYKVVAGIVSLSQPSLYTRQESQVSQGMVNPNFNPYSARYDIAVLKLQDPFTPTEFVSVISVPLQGFIPYGKVVVTGWGSTDVSSHENSDVLRKAKLEIMSQSECQYYYGDDADDTMFCAVSRNEIKDACYGDSGGPATCHLTNKPLLCGIVSAGIGCGDKNNPGTYTNVGEFINWIELVMGQLG